MITKEIYDKVVDRIDTEKTRLSSDDRSKHEKLLDDTMRAQQVYIDNMNFDDLNYNQDFMHELCVLLNI
jgi:adenine specific DNA methylase Mod